VSIGYDPNGSANLEVTVKALLAEPVPAR
jgi:hypothetical protein